MLTGKQEKFVRNIIQGMPQKEAYMNAYDCENMADDSIRIEAHRLINNPNITHRLKELQDKIDDAYIMTATERLRYLTDVIRGIEQEYVETKDGEDVERPATLRERMQAIDLMNKMQGEYVTKVDANVNADVNIVVELVDE